jgi:CubicO group peptidase (beta-lactamase class C family)
LFRLLVALAVLAAAFSAQIAQAAPSPSLRANLGRIMEKAHEDGDFNGVVLVAVGGDVVYQGAFGPADAEWGHANTADTRFGIASLTKSFTAHLIMCLVEAGKLGLDDPISRHLVQLQDRPIGAITIRHLLAHTAGIGDHLTFDEAQVPADVAEKWAGFSGASIAMFRDYAPFAKVLEPPGQRFVYSNDGYVLLGLVVEAATGSTFEDNLRRLLLEPAGMTQSGVNHHEKIIPRRARPYRRDGNRLLNAAWDDSGSHFSAGGMYSTVGDLLLWDRALRSGNVLSASSQDLMSAPGSSEAWDVFGFRQFGFGWWLKHEALLGRLVMHPGASPQYSAVIVRGLDRDVFIAALSNVSSVPSMGRYTPALIEAVSRSFGEAKP